MEQNINLVGMCVVMKNAGLGKIVFVKGNSLSDMNIYLDNGKGFCLTDSVGKGFIKLADEELNEKVVGLYQEKEQKKIQHNAGIDYSNLEDQIKARKERERWEEENTIYTSVLEYKFLSNMYACSVNYKGITYRSSESAYLAQKDPKRAKEFEGLTAYKAMILGNKVEASEEFIDNDFGIMKEILICKFTQNPELRKKLLNTGTKKLVEVNKHDTYWGKWEKEGCNKLGKLLMAIREELA